jgi:hypothetical protein
MKDDKAPRGEKIVTHDMPHDTKARRDQLEKAKEEWEKRERSSDDSLNSGDK